MVILHIGIKEWPYSSAVLEGKNRGGGVGKYADMLINGYPESVETIIITRRLKNQLRIEKINNIWVYRVRTLPGRKLRILSLGIVSLFKALSLVKKHNVALIQTHIFFNNIIGLILKNITGIPVLAVPHSALYHKYTPELSDIRRRLERLLERWLYKKLDKVIVFSDDHIERYKNYTGLNPANFHVIYTGIQIEPVPRPTFNFTHRIKLLFVGRLEKRKAIDKVIEAMHGLDKESLDRFRFDIVGEGNEMEFLRELVNKYQMSEHVIFHGYINNPAVYYRDSDVFLLVTHTEGLSMALLEAMASWNMCIVNNYGVPFKDDCVRILDNNDPETIRLALQEILVSPGIIESYANKAHKEIMNNFTVQGFVSQYVQLYESLTNGIYSTAKANN
jgi:glycosyltransferase involved in cell wall biosynthesis